MAALTAPSYLPPETLEQWLERRPVRVRYEGSAEIVGALPYCETLQLSDVYHIIHTLIPRGFSTTVTLVQSNGRSVHQLVTPQSTELVEPGIQLFDIAKTGFIMPELKEWADEELPPVCEDSSSNVSYGPSRSDVPQQFLPLFSQQMQQPSRNASLSQKSQATLKDVMKSRSSSYSERCRLRDGKCVLTGKTPFPEKKRDAGAALNFGVLQAAHIWPRKYAEQFPIPILDNGSRVLNPDELLSSPKSLHHYRKALGGWAGIDSLQNLVLLRSDIHQYYNNLAWVRVPDGRVVWVVPVKNPPTLSPLVSQDGVPPMYQFQPLLFDFQCRQAVAHHFMRPHFPLDLKAAAGPRDPTTFDDFDHLTHRNIEGGTRRSEGSGEEGDSDGESSRSDDLMRLADGLEGMRGGSGTLREDGGIAFEDGSIVRQRELLHHANMPEEQKRLFLDILQKQQPRMVK